MGLYKRTSKQRAKGRWSVGAKLCLSFPGLRQVILGLSAAHRWCNCALMLQQKATLTPLHASNTPSASSSLHSYAALVRRRMGVHLQAQLAISWSAEGHCIHFLPVYLLSALYNTFEMFLPSVNPSALPQLVKTCLGSL